MDLTERVKVAEAGRQGNLDQANALGEEIQVLSKRRQELLLEAIRFDGEVRALTALIKEEGD